MGEIMKLAALFLLSLAAFGQGNTNKVQTGVLDAHTGTWRFPETVFASLPSPAAANNGWRYTVTDCLTSACTAGGGTIHADLWSNGSSAWTVISGGPGQASIFSGGTLVQRQVECAHGTVDYTALTAAASSQEITIQTAISGNVRWHSIVLSETTQFASATGLTVSMGRPGSTTHAEMTNGGTLALQTSDTDTNFMGTRPTPPQITSTYSIVLNFAVTSGFVNAVTAGLLTWELCGYAAR